ncbi:hypothetical protein Mgra_00008008 [Meloidogyne graminicola]|uniref:Uncharacterized protein n=1 Tax=Meloidogyne graminicola TaxID=189291 RepID=A0A8S9ZH46_9BILA|nr:hypothetical protein Mgra_00008008 [Meloidogyne graminicola]
MGELDEKATAEELASFVASGRTGRRNALPELDVENTTASNSNNTNEQITNENCLAERFSRLETTPNNKQNTKEETKLNREDYQKCCSTSSQINEIR